MDAIFNWISNNPVITIIIVLVIFAILTYNNLNSKKKRVEKSFSTIEAHLQERFDKVGALLEQTLKAYEHEETVFSEVSRLRSGIIKAQSGTINDKINADNELRAFMLNPMIRTEAYPELTAITSLGMLTAKETVYSEEQILAARKQYNANATSYNTAITSFPTMIFAGLFGFKTPFELFKADEQAKTRVKMGDIQKGMAQANIDIANMKQAAETQQKINTIANETAVKIAETTAKKELDNLDSTDKQ